MSSLNSLHKFAIFWAINIAVRRAMLSAVTPSSWSAHLHAFSVTSAFHGGQRSAFRFGHFTSWERDQDTNWIGDCMVPRNRRHSVKKREASASDGNWTTFPWSSTTQPIYCTQLLWYPSLKGKCRNPWMIKPKCFGNILDVIWIW